ncbi:MAG: RNA-guided pseudouridylation complex pseudouridine synthase subunit Cbf5 [Thermoplasmatales archaeon]|nr:MAG: RNA-guided pseudouridylation complex pseudouridine synthase subunit Cbf5 [Thermoplasmatales archaeon]
MIEKKLELPSDKRRKRLIKIEVKTNPNYGKYPKERNIRELLQNGVINLDKPCGPTSHQIDSWLKNILEVDKVGHGGTLDPNATGVLPIAMCDAARALQVLLSAGKEYIGIMKIHKKFNENEILDICKNFVGDIYQIPPVRSAVKRVKRKRQIYYLNIIQIKNKEVLFRVGCESGTYIRTLCKDIGKKLKCGANLAELRRTRVGNLREKDSFILHDVKDAFIFWKEDEDEKMIRSIIQPMEILLDHVPKIVVRDSAVDAICHGASLAVPGISEIDTGIKKGDTAAVLTLKGEGVALVNTLMSTEQMIQKDSGICANLERVLMNKGTYPSIWKKP